MKYTTEHLRNVIVIECHKTEIQREMLEQFYFDENSEAVQLEKKNIILSATNPKSWKRISKERLKSSGEVLRIFDCAPLDDQLRAYVYTNYDDDKIELIEIVGE